MPPPVPVTLPHSSLGPVFAAIAAVIFATGILLYGAYGFGLITIAGSAPPQDQAFEASEGVTIRDGVYSLAGTGDGTPYSGTVEIRRRAGSATLYDFIWHFDDASEGDVVRGVGVYRNGIVSAGFYQHDTEGLVWDVGVASYTVEEGLLEGEWASLHEDNASGSEQLRWQSR